MPHPLVDQFRFTRSEWRRGLNGVTDADAARHFGPMNSIGWIAGHMAWHEQRYWVERAQGKVLFPTLDELFAYGAPMSTPALREMLEMWETVTRAADAYLDSLTTQSLQGQLLRDGKAIGQGVGSALRRITYHYWYRTGEIQAIRQMLGHKELAEYVGDIDGEAPYRPE